MKAHSPTKAFWLISKVILATTMTVLMTVLPASAEAQEAALTVYVDKAPDGSSRTAQNMHVYKRGEDYPALFSIVSTGREKAHETSTSGKATKSVTPAGTYSVTWMNKNHVSRTWEGAKMPYAIFFNGGIALHGVVESLYEKLGDRASGGCVRLPLYIAEELWDLVKGVGQQNVKIVVYDSSKGQMPRQMH